MKSRSLLLMLTLTFSLLTSFASQQSIAQEKNAEKSTEKVDAKQSKKTNLHQFQMKDIHGKNLDFKKFKGKTVLMVNVASKCGFTPHYEGLQSLYAKYKDQGLVVVGVPCNQFGGQEPGTNLQILEFCKDTYDVSFPLTDKIKVKGKEKHELFKYLTKQKSKNVKPGEVRWNFEKFVIDGNGKLIGRFSTRTKPSDKKMVKMIETSLAMQKKKTEK